MLGQEWPHRISQLPRPPVLAQKVYARQGCGYDGVPPGLAGTRVPLDGRGGRHTDMLIPIRGHVAQGRGSAEVSCGVSFISVENAAGDASGWALADLRPLELTWKCCKRIFFWLAFLHPPPTLAAALAICPSHACDRRSVCCGQIKQAHIHATTPALSGWLFPAQNISRSPGIYSRRCLGDGTGRRSRSPSWWGQQFCVHRTLLGYCLLLLFYATPFCARGGVGGE